MSELKLTSAGFAHNQPIPKKYSSEANDLAPPLQWEGAPVEAKSFALTCDDPDAPVGTFAHWVLYGIPASITALPEALPKTETVPTLGGAKQGINDFGRIGWGGPCPPRGHGVHHYHFKLYALETELNLPPKATKRKLEEAMKGHILVQAELVGTYERK
jgi:Raf kinase inhibitor-like YbhB/YbcL family protein